MALKGNKNALGNKGGGRKSIREEIANFRMLEEMYLHTPNQEELEAKIRQGKFSIKDRHMLNALEGDQKAITPIFNKVFPDKIEHSGEIESKIVIVDE